MAPRRILTVCTANACRSPVVERLLQRDLAAVGREVVVRSAGVHGGGYRVPPPTAEAASIVGVDLSDHESRRLTAELVRTDGADLVVGMTREHVQTAVALVPDSFGRAFTLRELVRRTEALTVEPANWSEWLAACHAGRRHADLLVPDPADDLPDPIGLPVAAHILMVQEVLQMSRRLTNHIPRP